MDGRTQFKRIDLTLFTVLAIVSEYLAFHFINIFSEAGFMISFSFLLGLIAIYRWGAIGSVVYIGSGVVSLIMNYQSIDITYQFLYYVVANAAIVSTILMFRFFTKEDIKTKWFVLLLYMLFPMLIIGLSKGLLIFIFEKNLHGFIDYFASQLLTLVMTYIVLNIVIRIEGLFEDMKTYIRD